MSDYDFFPKRNILTMVQWDIKLVLDGHSTERRGWESQHIVQELFSIGWSIFFIVIGVVGYLIGVQGKRSVLWP